MPGSTGLSFDALFRTLMETVERRYDAQEEAMRVAAMTAKDVVNTAMDASRALGDANDRRYEETFAAIRASLQVEVVHLTKQLQDHIEAVRAEAQSSLDSAARAVEKAEASTEKRFESVNEFRSQLAEQAATFLPRTEYDRAHADLVAKVDNLQRELTDKLEAAVKGLEARIAAVITQLSGVEAVVR